MADKQVEQVLSHGEDADGNLTRRVRFTDGTEATQTATMTVEGRVTRADGTVEPVREITDIRLRSVGLCHE